MQFYAIVQEVQQLFHFTFHQERYPDSPFSSNNYMIDEVPLNSDARTLETNSISFPDKIQQNTCLFYIPKTASEDDRSDKW
ncbi:hypothetical protein FIV31_06860 [Coxiella endosymbiont of Ornithodoros amblus]|uniref:hypothetical protein n=1 Tax=Coxiella endosymbiont of Ornithodoros amblus TaxID=1656166 RepID=UPI00244E3555|nr:hypothetical protein [Coxiella endosymbiont of Ornithodoros amblus]MBW5803001.1 hypothetical protein [Coxiella endosymbiont of Ornithodoros amblus]